MHFCLSDLTKFEASVFLVKYFRNSTSTLTLSYPFNLLPGKHSGSMRDYTYEGCVILILYRV